MRLGHGQNLIITNTAKFKGSRIVDNANGKGNTIQRQVIQEDPSAKKVADGFIFVIRI